MTMTGNRNPNLFANNPLSRVAHRRSDAAWIAQALEQPNCRVAIFNAKREPLITDRADEGVQSESRAHIKWMTGAALTFFGPESMLVFLGELGDVPHFALLVPRHFDLEALPLAGHFQDLRTAAGALLSPDEAAIAGLAAWVLDWHQRHGFCAACGEASAVADAGWKRICPACRTEHFPRVDPVAIMLAVRGDSCLLGRQKAFPRGMYSALAGFVEPGETVEEACVRELAEEAGIVAAAEDVTYIYAQPWPFPASLMFGLQVEAKSTYIVVDPLELEDARWFSREEVAQMCAQGLPTPDGTLFVPPGMAIARRIIDRWVAAE